ncbi:molybdopterin-dependent oxidoreductase [Halobiforma nitratireducens]|uniref:Molybdopterin oxidoreductase n=1 Tax=Halobiforma nitratireducens JCM 10879 TaxID=1227454 RepID=M0MPE3_9EURY|nr:molybdopterin-dependent oxidoreductase [Halobiforma nitratireducens]EMA46594.1 molybdopterin oxidoreductase [Halobiforma nitratireducens JCM 10879]
MSKNDTTNDPTDTTDSAGLALDRRGFMKTGAAGAVAAGLGLSFGLSSLVEADDYRDALVEHTGEWRASTCAGCTSWCAAQILVDDETGRAIRTRGNEHSQVHGRNDCVRQDMAIQQLYDPDRLKQPMRRTNPEKGKDVDPEFEPISWEEAIEEIADKIMELRENEETHKAMVTRGRYTYLRPILYSHFPQIIGTPNNISHSAICAEAEKAGPMFTEGEWSYRQYDVTETRYVICWGADPISTNRQVSHYSHEFGDLLDRAEVAVVEPRLSSTASKADEWLPVEPGYDGAIASAMAHVILTEGLWNEEFVGEFEDGDNRFVEGEEVDPDTFDESENSHGVVQWWNLELNDKTPEWAEEESGVPAEQIERVARRFAQAGPNAISWLGGGPCMQIRGTYTAMAVHALNGLVGSVGNEGGTLYAPDDGTASLPGPDEFTDEIAEEGLAYPEEHGTGDKIDQRGSLELPALKGGESGGGVVTNNAADGILEEDPMEIELLISYWNNYAFSNPESQRWEDALEKIPFHVTIETHPSETAWFADILLPATHHQFERWGQLRSTANGIRSINLHQPVLADDPDDPEDVLDNGRLWDVKTDETEIVYLIAEELADRGFDNLFEYCEQYEDPETGLAPSEEYDGGSFRDRELRAQAFSRNAAKLRTQPMWDPDVEAPPGDEFDGWEEFREAGVWNSDHWEYRHRWPSEGGEFDTATGRFEFFSETLRVGPDTDVDPDDDIDLEFDVDDPDGLEGHAERHDTDVDDVLETCNYLARTDGERHAYVPHYEEPYDMGDDGDYPFKFVDYKDRLNREGRSANATWLHEFKDVNPGDEPWEDVAKLNPRDAAELGIEDGDEIRISSPAGEIEVTAKLWEGVKPGTVAKTWGQGHWAYGRVASEEFGEEEHGGSNNRLIGAEYDRLSGSSVFYGDVCVDVEKL